MTCPTPRARLTGILKAFAAGESPAKICIAYGLSERGYFDLIRKHPKGFLRAKKTRLMNQKKKREKAKTLKQGTPTDPVSKGPKMTTDEQIAKLERQLENERKKNKDLEKLLEIAKEFLGKS